MRKTIRKSACALLAATCLLGGTLTACGDDGNGPAEETAYTLKREDIRVDMPEEGFATQADQVFKITVTSVSDQGVLYAWSVDGKQVSTSKDFEYLFEREGEYTVTLTATQGDISYEYEFTVTVTADGQEPEPEGPTPYVTRVIDFMPAVGQFTNSMPEYEEGDTQEDMNRKVLEAIGGNRRGTVSLGGYGGYVTVGFDHTIENKEGLCDFRVLGNAFYADANPSPGAPLGGNCEPGVIQVAYDRNGNGLPDDDEWYEIAGSAHDDPSAEPWMAKAEAAGNDVRLYRDYEITYYRPEKEPETEEEMARYIRWEDNQGHSGYKAKNGFHAQPYFPQWVGGGRLTFRGTCLPQNGIDESGQGSYYVTYAFRHGYADNHPNDRDGSAIDIGRAVDAQGRKAGLPGADFIRIYTGVNQENGWTGECSTEVTGVEDLHLLGTEIPAP